MRPPFRAVGIAIAAMLSLQLFGDEIDVARQALRDGLWDVARAHALRAGEESSESRAVVAESYAREGKWKDLLDAMEKWGNPAGDVFTYYRALALFETGMADKAGFIVSDRKFSDGAYSLLATRLKARIALAAGGAAEALKVVENEGGARGSDDDSVMFAASLMSAAGDRKGAAELWREVVSRGTNAGERAFAAASVGLGDEKLIKEAYDRALSSETKRLAGYALGRSMLAKKGGVDEGAALVRSLVRDAPDAPGARDALAAVADAYLDGGRHAEAVAAYKEIFETWPDAAKSSILQDGLGWALEKLGRHDEALEAFKRAEEAAPCDAVRAMEIVKQGDVLAAAGQRDEALLKYRGVLEKFPETESASRIKDLVRLRDLEDHGRDLYREYRFAEAQKVFAQVAAKDASRKPRMEYLEVMCLYGQGLDDDAERKARAIASASPDRDIRAAATLWLAKHSYNRGAWAEARRLFAAYAEMSPSSAEAPESLVWSARAAFAEGDFNAAIQVVTKLDESYPKSPARLRGFLVQGEALIELARFDEAVLVLERAALADGLDAADRLRARMLGADALFAMGADNPQRYQEALEAYRGIRMGESLDASQRLSLSYKIAKTLEKMKRMDDAVDRYYTDVVLAYREGRMHGVRYNDEARASFSRAAFRLADEYESRGRDYQAVHVLELVAASDVPASSEAEKRITRIQRKGNFL